MRKVNYLITTNLTKTKDMANPGEEITIQRLKEEIANEKQMIEMLNQSYQELDLTANELSKRMDGLNEESNEWQTRYETQKEINERLERQIFLYSDKIDDARNTYKARTPKSKKVYTDVEVSPMQVKNLEREKDSLARQLRDFEWRLDQESKAYHKANEERKQYALEINTAKDLINKMKHKQKNIIHHESEVLIHSPQGTNIPPNQRILDPKKGPIKKTAAVKTLPKLE